MNDFNKAPFPYTGGKRRIAAAVWDAFGIVDTYLEPFFGSGAVLLNNPYPPKREVVCDKSPHIANFWRALQTAPLEVAKWADFPTSHMDLTARHKWLVKWAQDNHGKVCEDAEYCDPKAAGWYAWGLSNWIGGGFCMDAASDKVPFVRDSDGNGPGVRVPDKRQTVYESTESGKGVSQMRDGFPNISREIGGKALQQHRIEDGAPQGMPLDGSRLRPWLLHLHERMRKVIVLHRDWTSCVTKIMTMDGASGNKVVGVFLDPPYRVDQGNRSASLYQSDADGTSDDAAKSSYEWALEIGSDPRYRIAYACRFGDFPIPAGWRADVRGFSGIKDKARREKHMDCVMFSPHCFNPGEGDLFSGDAP